MKLNEITGMPKAKGVNDLLQSIKNGKFTKDGRALNDSSHGFYFNNCKLSSLEGCPLIATKDFICSENRLVTLKGGPQKVDGIFDCDNNQLTTLEGAPQETKKNFWAQTNKLISLKGSPQKVGGAFSCWDNKLTSLEGCPEEVGDNFYCAKNKLTTLKDVHKHLKKMNGRFYAENNPIKSHVLGLLKIPGCKSVVLDNAKVEKILNKYLPLGDLIDCQEELIEAGFEEYAQL